MDIITAIKTRRSIAKMQDRNVPNTIIEKIIQSGCWAPNHKRTEPWNFVVFTGEGRAKLQNAVNEGFKNLYADLPKNEQKQKLEKVSEIAFRSPVIIAVWCAIGRGKSSPPHWEEEAAVAACLQNMCLTTHSLSLASIWRTGSVTDMPEVQSLCKSKSAEFNASKGDKILGFLYIGYEDKESTHPSRDTPEYETKVTWLDK